MEGITAMENAAESYDLVTVLLRLEALKGMGHEIGRHSIDDLGVPVTDVVRTGLFRKILLSLRWRQSE